VNGRLNIKSLFYKNEEEFKDDFDWSLIKDKKTAIDLKM